MKQPVVEVFLDPTGATDSLVQDVRRGLGTHPRTLPPKWLYDDRGSDLFDQITRLPEYYPTRKEREILIREAAEIVRLSGADTIIELGSGTSDKTRTLLDAFSAAGQLRCFVPLDFSEGTLRAAVKQLAVRYPDVQMHAIAGDFTLHLGKIPRGGTRLVAFLGGTIGNFYEEERRAFLGALGDVLETGDSLLLGTDLVKDADRLVLAYNDPGGVTADFVRNSLHVINRELRADFDPGAYSYIPFWDAHQERMDLRLRADTPQHVRVPGASLEFDLAPGEEIRVEISTKFRTTGLSEELADAGFRLVKLWTDEAGDFGVSLATRNDR